MPSLAVNKASGDINFNQEHLRGRNPIVRGMTGLQLLFGKAKPLGPFDRIGVTMAWLSSSPKRRERTPQQHNPVCGAEQCSADWKRRARRLASAM
jgi:hypothetical protein